MGALSLYWSITFLSSRVRVRNDPPWNLVTPRESASGLLCSAVFVLSKVSCAKRINEIPLSRAE